MKNRFQVTNRYTDVLSANVSLVPANTGTTTIPATTPPNLTIGKFFHIILKPVSLTKRLVLRCFLDTGNVVKINNREIPTSAAYLQNDQIAIFDVAELFNESYHHIDDFGYVDKKYSGLDVIVRGGLVMVGGATTTVVADSTLTMTNNTTNYIYLNYTTGAFATSVTVPTYPILATVVTSGGAVTTVTDLRPYNLSNGDVVGPSGSTNNNIPLFDGITGKLLKDSGKSFSIDGALAGNSDDLIPTQKAVKTYADTKIPLSYLDVDGTLAADSDTKVPSQKAVKTYADTKIAKTTNVTAIDETGIADNDLVIFDKTNKTIKGSGRKYTDLLPQKKGTTAAMSGVTIDHVDADSVPTSVVTWTASGEPNGFIEVDVGTPGHIIFTSTVAETISFTYVLTI